MSVKIKHNNLCVTFMQVEFTDNVVYVWNSIKHQSSTFYMVLAIFNITLIFYKLTVEIIL